MSLTSCKISEKSNEPILSNIQESPKNDWDWPKSAKREFSLKKGLESTYTPLNGLSLHGKYQKNLTRQY